MSIVRVICALRSVGGQNVVGAQCAGVVRRDLVTFLHHSGVEDSRKRSLFLT